MTDQTKPKELILDGARWDELDGEDRDRLIEMVRWHAGKSPLKSLHVKVMRSWKGSLCFTVEKVIAE